MTAAPEQFTGFMVEDEKSWTTFKKQKFTPKVFEEYDVDIEKECCGVCGSDVHSITGGWGGMPTKPLWVGHEIIGRVLRVGPKVKTIKIRDRVGVGAQAQSCMKCPQCKSDNENYCPHQLGNYGAPYKLDGGNPDKPVSDKDMKDKDGNQIFSQGGYSSHSRVHEQFVFKVPDNIPSIEAGPMMCDGLTVYSPLKRAGTGPGKKVAIVGIGGLWHFALLWARALGAEVWALSHSPDKETEAKKLGAHHFVATTEKGWNGPLAFTFDFILDAADMTHTFNMKYYMSCLAVNGEFHNVGIPGEPLPQLAVFDFAPNGCKVGGSHIGSKKEAEEMLKLASEKNIHPVIETIPISDSGCSEAVQKVKNNEVRYRITLTDFKKAFSSN